MSGGFQFLDIIFFAMVAAFLVLRLRSVLGRRTGHEQQHAEGHMRRRGVGQSKQPQAEAQEPQDRQEVERQMSRAAGPGAPADVTAGLTQIKLAAPAFDPQEFVEGAKSAFEMVISAFASGDRETLNQLVGDDVLTAFIDAIDAREEAGKTMEHRLVALHKAAIAGAEMKGRNAFVTIEFVSDQINVVRDAQGTVVEGDADDPSEIVDQWTFTRDTASDDPTWTLVVTESG
ncbi:MAG: Tim44/TimA family putative adaptor protein [Acetobacterales bacterium]